MAETWCGSIVTMALSCKHIILKTLYKALIKWSILTSRSDIDGPIVTDFFIQYWSIRLIRLTDTVRLIRYYSYRVFEEISLRKNTGLRHLNTEFKSSIRYHFPVLADNVRNSNFWVQINYVLFNLQMVLADQRLNLLNEKTGFWFDTFL